MAEAASSSISSGSAPPTSPFVMTSTSSVATKPPKRRLNTIPDYDFFAPAASSFHPRPYAPNSHSSDGRNKPFQFTRSHGRSHDSLAVPAGMDPHLSDPNVIFIHPPFTTFPNADQHPEGLTYQHMAENPDWFLDSKDFVHENNSNTHAIPYPPALEPPRGWCPAKKKDLKERGVDGWPEGEEPRLRCTFCRRNYAGVNAKSMWRRHVFEKHKIAMANRRDGTDRPRGRSSNKENKQVTNRGREGHDTVVKLEFEIAPGTEVQNTSHKSKFRSSINAGPSTDLEGSSQSKAKDISPARLPPESAMSEQAPQPSGGPSMTPPLTPRSSSDIGNTESSDGVPPTPLSASLIPPSPYNPLLTPSFRHSPPRLPSDQPWRFPSPSHPLHSQTRELSLSMLVRNAASPLVKDPPALGGSPLIYIPSPSTSSRFSRPETPLSGFKLPLSSSTRARLTKPRITSSPLAPRADITRSRPRIDKSPSSCSTTLQHKRSFSELTDDWFSEASMISNQLSDPFTSLFSSGGAGRNSPMKRVLEAESPILRNRNSAETRGLGIGLLEPFHLVRRDTPDVEGDLNDILDSSSSPGDTHELHSSEPEDRAKQGSRQSSSPPLAKKRRISVKS